VGVSQLKPFRDLRALGGWSGWTGGAPPSGASTDLADFVAGGRAAAARDAVDMGRRLRSIAEGTASRSRDQEPGPSSRTPEPELPNGT